MKTAADRVGRGKARQVNARFAARCAKYLFDPDFGELRHLEHKAFSVAQMPTTAATT